MAALATLAQAKKHLRVDTVDQDVDIALKLNQASAMILRYLNGRRISVLTLTSSGGVVTVTTAVAHGLTTNDVVTIWGAVELEYNGAFTVTVTASNTFTYVILGTPASPATGGIGLSTAERWTDLTVPGPVQAAVLVLLTHLYENRGDDLETGESVWTGIERLLVTYKVSALA